MFNNNNIEHSIMEPHLEMYVIEGCPFCNAARELVKSNNIPCKLIIVEPKDKSTVKKQNNMATFPQIFLNKGNVKTKIGGYQNLVNSL